MKVVKVRTDPPSDFLNGFYRYLIGISSGGVEYINNKLTISQSIKRYTIIFFLFYHSLNHKGWQVNAAKKIYVNTLLDL